MKRALTAASRRLWALATQVAKSALTADQARDKSTELLEKGKALLDALTLPEVTLNTELMAKITAVKSYQDVLINIADKDLQEQMSGLKDQIKATVEEKICPAEIMSEFTGWLSLQWQQPPESADETSLLLASSDKLKDFWSNLSIKGLGVESATWYQLVIILEKLEAFEKHESSKRMFAALTLRHELDQQCRKLRSNPSWAEALKGATGRLDLLTEEIGFSLLKSAAQNSGEKEAYKICQGFPHCHGKLASCFEILAKASTFKAISEERISDDIAGLAKCMGEIVAVASTDSTLLAAMLPSCGPAHKAYLDKVLDVLKIDLDDTSMKLSDWSESLARFRPSS
ncbi:unnamed protein product [Durusdinium trenchii]|uniref:Uncharacterized protein n=1 Tax=Durusdinium trenchii TaxID=1381693 RepID=A0ABP0MG41_9DINO